MRDLLERALDHPREARREAEALLDERDPLVRSFAWQALGIVLRDEGSLREALVALRRGLLAAAEAGDGPRQADVRATYATALAFAGRIDQALTEFDTALGSADEDGVGRVALRKAGVLAHVGRYREAIVVARGALRDFERTDDRVWSARTHVWLGHLEVRLGHLSAAESEINLALELLDGADGADRIAALGNLAELAAIRGDLASSLRLYSETIDAYERIGFPPRMDDVVLFAQAYLAAGLPNEACALLEQFDGGLGPLQTPQFSLMRAAALFAAGDAAAHEASRSAVRAFRRQRRRWFELRARLVSCQVTADASPTTARQARDVAQELHVEQADEAPVALTLAGRLAKGEERGELWRKAASYRNHPNALVRAAAWMARALEREEAGDRGGALRACRAGLDAIDEQRRLLGSSELRAQATTHGRELTEVALRAAAPDPRRLLGWVERTRA
ncbi:MAG TPA: hypothetical protein VJ872_11805, partial [Nocardioides sp.]|nr:hypothetical protein [Nocardioides sp.]